MKRRERKYAGSPGQPESPGHPGTSGRPRTPGRRGGPGRAASPGRAESPGTSKAKVLPKSEPVEMTEPVPVVKKEHSPTVKKEPMPSGKTDPPDTSVKIEDNPPTASAAARPTAARSAAAAAAAAACSAAGCSAEACAAARSASLNTSSTAASVRPSAETTATSQAQTRTRSVTAAFGRSGRPCCITMTPCCERRPQGVCCRVNDVDTDAFGDMPPKPGDDALNTEFIYFSAALRQSVPELEDGRARRLTIQWLRKLFSPEYHCPSLRDKRNRYLMSLAGTLLAECPPSGVLARPPPLGPLPELQPPTAVSPAAWQRLDPWEALRTSRPLNQQAAGGDAAPCPVHAPLGQPCPAVDSRTTHLLDDEFCLFTWLSRPRARALCDVKMRSTAASWMRALALVGPDACPMLKGMRNDYALALLSQLEDGDLRGPLERAPQHGEPLLPLAEAARRSAAKETTPPFCDLATPALQHFIRAQPRIDNGAFCYVLVNPALSPVEPCL